MNLLLVISGSSLIALACTILATSRSRRRRIRVRFRSNAAASALVPVTGQELPAQEALPEQLSLFEDWELDAIQLVPAPVEPAAVNLAPDHARRGQKTSGTRLDWEYFKKDAGDLADPALPARFRPVSALNLEEQPVRRA